MPVSWTQHRFAGGALVLDVTNTVVLRSDPHRRFDRFDDPAEVVRFAAAASRFRSSELKQRPLAVTDPEWARHALISLREAADALFRLAAAEPGLEPIRLARLLEVCAATVARSSASVWHGSSSTGSRPVAIEIATSVSALGMLAPERRERIRICPNCGWLFLDASRNASRRWCDMAVCGNRTKARRHYRRRIAEETDAPSS